MVLEGFPETGSLSVQAKGCLLDVQLLCTHVNGIERVLRQVPQLKALANIALAGIARARALGCGEVCLAKVAEQQHPPALHVLLAIGDLQHCLGVVLPTINHRSRRRNRHPCTVVYALYSHAWATVSCAKHHAVHAIRTGTQPGADASPRASCQAVATCAPYYLDCPDCFFFKLAPPASPTRSPLQIKPPTHHAVQAVQVALDLLWAGAVLLSALLDHVARALSIPVAVVQDAGGQLAVPASPARLLQAPRRLWPSCTAARSTEQPRHRMLMETRSSGFGLLSIAVALTCSNSIPLSGGSNDAKCDIV